jgi:putative transcriptional regulator
MEKDVFTKKLAKRITKVRVEKDLTQEELGKLLGKSKQSINRLESGVFTPTAYFTFEIARVLKVPIGELMEI